MDKKVVIFQHLNVLGKHNLIKKEFEFESNATEKEIEAIYIKWILTTVENHFTWFEKEDG